MDAVLAPMKAILLHPDDRAHWLKSKIMTSQPMSNLSVKFTAKKADFKIWHQRFAHPHKNVLQHINDKVTNKVSIPTKDELCKGCAEGKMHAKPMPLSTK